jgi:uncharacterized membrane protein
MKYIFTAFLSTFFVVDLMAQNPKSLQTFDPNTSGESVKTISFGNDPGFIELRSTKNVVIDFPTCISEGKVGVRVNEEELILDELVPINVELAESGTISIKLFDPQGNKDRKFNLSDKNSMKLKIIKKKPVFSNDAIVFGILFLCLGLIFFTSSIKTGFFPKFYTVIPALLMCYLLPSILVSLGLINAEVSQIYSIAKNYLLPTSLILMTLSIDFKGIIKLGRKSVIMFLTGTAGVIIGGPLAILIIGTISPETVGGSGPDAVWRGLATLAGSWIGGGANQTAMLETYGFNPQKYGGMVLVDIVVANIWMAVLLFGVGKKDRIDKWLKADSSAITDLQERVEKFTASITKNPSLSDLMIVLGVGFVATALAHFISQGATAYFTNLVGEDSVLSSSFFWIVVMATTFGLILSFTPARALEGYGASKIGSVFIYILVASIGMKMDLLQILENPMLILVGLVWMAIHVGLLVIVAKRIKAPFFFLAVGSKANIGGAASAPIVAAAFHPALAPVGVLLAVLGYALGTYGAILCATLMELASKF